MTKITHFNPEDKFHAFLKTCGDTEYTTGPLNGENIAIKDNISTKGIETTCGSRILTGYIPPYDAHVITLLKKAGAAIVGKTNMDEFGMGTTTENSAFGPTLNPSNPDHVPGGSSGGSAAAVAAGIVPFALGSDTGGSIRCPASFCGITGLKPSYGRVSRYGLIAYANSLEQIGPMAKDVKSVSRLMEIITEYDPRDPTMINKPYHCRCDGELNGISVGVPEEFFGKGVDPSVASVVWNAIKWFEGEGAEIITCRMPSVEYALAAYYVTCTCEASSNLARFDGVRYGPGASLKLSWHDSFSERRTEGFGTEVKRRIMLGTFALSSGYYGKYYAKAQIARENVKNDCMRIFKDVDLIIGPTMPVVAFKLGEISDPLQMYLTDILTVPANLAGLPAISIPCGKVDGLPVGLQIIGKPFEDERVVETAYCYEQGG